MSSCNQSILLNETQFQLVKIISVLVLCALCAAGCSGRDDVSTGSMPGPAGPVILTDLSFDLPDPATVLQELREAKSASYFDFELARLGSEFDSSLPHPNVTAEGSSGTFDADWTDGGGLAGVAYCTYSFTVSDYDGNAKLSLIWAETGEDGDGMYIGISNWNTDRWDWFAADAAGTIDFGDTAPYFNGAGDLLVVAASISAESWRLDLLRLGDASAPADWYHSWGGSGSDLPNSIAADGKGSIYVAGKTEGFGAENNDGLLLKYDAAGTFVWARTVDVGNRTEHNDVTASPQGGVFTCGRILTGTGIHKHLVQGWSSDGDLLWTRTMGAEYLDSARGIVATADAVYVTGGSFRDDTFWSDVIVAKYNHSGDLLKMWHYGGTDNEIGTDIVLGTGTGGETELHVIANQSNNFASDFDRPLYLKVDESLEVLSAQVWESADKIFANDITVVDPPAQRIFITGHIESIDFKLLLLEVTAADPPVARSFWLEGEYVDGFGITSLADNTLAIAGIAPLDETSGLLLNTSINGEFLGARGLTVEGSYVQCADVCSTGGQHVALALSSPEFSSPSWEPLTLDSSTLSGSWESVIFIAGPWGQPVAAEEVNANAIHTGIHDAPAGSSDTWTGSVTVD